MDKQATKKEKKRYIYSLHTCTEKQEHCEHSYKTNSLLHRMLNSKAKLKWFRLVKHVRSTNKVCYLKLILISSQNTCIWNNFSDFIFSALNVFLTFLSFD